MAVADPAVPQLALEPRDAAAALAVSLRTLWGLTAPRGPIPCVRVGRCVRYLPEDLREFLASARQKVGA